MKIGPGIPEDLKPLLEHLTRAALKLDILTHRLSDKVYSSEMELKGEQWANKQPASCPFFI
jgi:hypothetical protein